MSRTPRALPSVPSPSLPILSAVLLTCGLACGGGGGGGGPTAPPPPESADEFALTVDGAPPDGSLSIQRGDDITFTAVFDVVATGLPPTQVLEFDFVYPENLLDRDISFVKDWDPEQTGTTGTTVARSDGRWRIRLERTSEGSFSGDGRLHELVFTYDGPGGMGRVMLENVDARRRPGGPSVGPIATVGGQIQVF